ncbi:MAG TPA: hypothetical protein VGO87_13505 [Acidimicrobiia bacterium]|jgi:putative sterol carrier protein
MATFATAQQVYDTIGLFLDQLCKDPEIGPKFVAADTSFLIRYSDPECTMMMDATVDPPVMTMNPDPGTETEIALEMAADDGHAFWKGEMNMALALAKGKVKVSGPISKIMKLLPAMRPAFPKYKAFLAERGGVA